MKTNSLREVHWTYALRFLLNSFGLKLIEERLDLKNQRMLLISEADAGEELLSRKSQSSQVDSRVALKRPKEIDCMAQEQRRAKMTKLALDIERLKQKMSIVKLSLKNKAATEKSEFAGRKEEDKEEEERKKEKERKNKTNHNASNKVTQGVDSHREETSRSLKTKREVIQPIWSKAMTSL